MRVTRRLVPGLVAAALALPVTVATAPGTGGTAELTAVVSYASVLPQVDGLEVERALPAVRSAVVSGSRAELAALAAAPGVRSVVPDYPLQVTGAGNRPGEPVLASRGIGNGAGRPGAGRGVRVAVVDTGVSDTPALNRASGRLVDAVDTRRGATPGEPLTDGFGHGTFMASIVAGGSLPETNGRPVGVAPAATVLVVRVAQADGTTSLSQVLGGLDWIAAHRDEVDVVSLSLGAERPGPDYVRDPLTDAVQAVQDGGVTVVVSAGNEAGELSDPGFLPTTITVGAASTRTQRVAASSGSGVVAGVRKPDLVASGVSVLGALPPDSLIAQSHPGARVSRHLWRGSGSSQATAVTSGAAAILLSRHPDARPADVKATLQDAAAPLPDRRAGSGLLRLPRRLVRATAQHGAVVDGPSAREPSATSWDAATWDAVTWDAVTWDAVTWDAVTWDAVTWDAVTWGADPWDEP